MVRGEEGGCGRGLTFAIVVGERGDGEEEEHGLEPEVGRHLGWSVRGCGGTIRVGIVPYAPCL